MLGERTATRPDLDDGIVATRPNGRCNALEDGMVGQEVLAETLANRR
jgi:hypothetical protein